jgi:predicted restriction endonuclease
MVKFLLQRPIAVLMAFTACFIVGLVTYFSLPVSLLPDIAIPQITIQVTGENSSARELENTVVTPVRRQLLQVAGLREIKSETRDGAGVIRLEFDFGVNTDLAFIEVNEKIDAAMNSLPKEVTRPKAIKASATDIPVLYVNMTLKNDGAYQETDEQQFLELCELAENVVKRRIEQLPEVAMADITGVPGRLLQIVQPIWDEFFNNQEELIFLSEKILAEKENYTVEQKFEELFFDIKELKGEVKLREIKTRVNQNVFRQMVISNYTGKCAISGIDIPELLVASHIVPWSINEEERLNPENGICFSALYDKAFDKGLIGIDEQYKILLSKNIKKNKEAIYYDKYFAPLENQTLTLPQKYLPKKEFIQYHLDVIFQKI